MSKEPPPFLQHKNFTIEQQPYTCPRGLDHFYIHSSGARRGAVASGTALQAGRSRVWFPIVLLAYSIDIIFLAAIMALRLTQPLTEISSYQEYFLRSKSIGLTTLPPSCADCMASGSSHIKEKFWVHLWIYDTWKVGTAPPPWHSLSNCCILI
jgi:hypothetical protein